MTIIARSNKYYCSLIKIKEGCLRNNDGTITN